MRSLPFDSQISGYDDDGYPIYDRAADSSQLSALFKRYFTNGIFTNPSTSFQVVTNIDGDMSVIVKAGAGNINGYFCDEDTDRTLVLQASSTAYDRIDSVVLRLNLNVSVRSIDLYVLQGTGASNPTAPELARNSSIYELCLAEIYIPKNTTSISASRITDTRLDTNKCGVVQQTIQTIDTSSIFIQYQAALDEYLEIVASALDETIAVNLQNQIDNVNTDLSNIWNVIYPIGSIYMSTRNTSPSTLFGGSWEQIKDTFLLATGSTYTAGSSGGAATVTLSSSQIPSHNHSIPALAMNAIGEHTHSISSDGTHTHTWDSNTNGYILGTYNTGVQTASLASAGGGYWRSNLPGGGGHTHSISTASAHTHTTVANNTGTMGSGQSHNNMPPYTTVYMWKRTA